MKQKCDNAVGNQKDAAGNRVRDASWYILSGQTMKIPGFYIAHHITFDAHFGANHVFKVGHTGDLRRRLQDNAFQTCFLHKFKCALTVETKTTKEAQDLEKDVLGDLARKKPSMSSR